jgi:hypothetical protein
MDRYISEPIEHPRTHGEGGTFSRVDLVFYDVDPLGQSYYGLVFLDAPDADETTPTEASAGFAGWFTVFGHGGCFGDDEDHCAPPPPAREPTDISLPVGIPLQTKIVTVTDALRAVEGDTFRVTVVPVMPGENGPTRADVLEFGRLRLLSYE